MPSNATVVHKQTHTSKIVRMMMYFFFKPAVCSSMFCVKNIGFRSSVLCVMKATVLFALLLVSAVLGDENKVVGASDSDKNDDKKDEGFFKGILGKIFGGDDDSDEDKQKEKIKGEADAANIQLIQDLLQKILGILHVLIQTVNAQASQLPAAGGFAGSIGKTGNIGY
uniref:Secreted protein n=1 Tax=Steinernema glaseri TaxID=37863 RepID=A0A1I8A8Q3_9BILA